MPHGNFASRGRFKANWVHPFPFSGVIILTISQNPGLEGPKTLSKPENEKGCTFGLPVPRLGRCALGPRRSPSRGWEGVHWVRWVIQPLEGRK